MRNILSNPHVGLLFLVPGRDETLRVNGRACLVRDADLLDRMAVNGRRPHIAIAVEVQEVFMHCGKASLRAHLWEPAHWPDVSALAPAGCMLLEHSRARGTTLEEMEQRLRDDAKALY